MKTVKELLTDADPLRREPKIDLKEHNRRRQAIIAAASASASDAAPARVRVSRVAILALVAIIMFLFGRGMWPWVAYESQAAVRFEVRLAEIDPAPGLREVKLSETGRTIYLHQEVVVSNEDIARAAVVGGNLPLQYSISVQFNADGERKMRAATENHIGKPMAILIDDEVVMAPTVRSPIGGSAVINGDYTREQAERIVNGIGRQ